MRLQREASRVILQELKPRSKLLGARPAAGLAVSGNGGLPPRLVRGKEGTAAKVYQAYVDKWEK